FVSVAEIRNEFVDMVGNNVFSVFFSVTLQVKQFGNFVCLVALMSHFVVVLENNVFVCKRMGGFNFYVVKSFVGKFFLCFQLYRLVESKVKYFGCLWSCFCVFNYGRGLTRTCNSIYLDVAR